MPTESRQLSKLTVLFLGFSAFFVCISMSLYQISVAVFMVLALLHWMLSGRRNVWNLTWLVLLGLFVLGNLCSLIYSEYAVASRQGIFKVLRHLLLCLAVIWVVDSKQKFKTVIGFFMAGGFVACIDALIQAKTGQELINQRKMVAYMINEGFGRVTGPLHHANDFAGYLCLVLFIFLAFFTVRAQLHKVWAWVSVVGVVLSSTCLVLTFSRGAWLAVVLVLVLWALFSRNRWMMAGLGVLGVWVAFFSPEAVRSRLTSFWDPAGGTVSERAALWGEAWRMIQARPWFGFGVNTYANSSRDFKAANSVSPDFQYAHNSFLQMGAEIGLVGLMVFVACLAWLFFVGFSRTAKSGDGFLKGLTVPLLCGIFAFLLHSGTDTNLQSTLLVNAMWLCIGMVWALERISRETRPSS